MSHLLLFYQYMRTKREVTKLTAQQFKFSQKYDRVKKNITNVQKMYTSRIANIEQQAKAMTAMGKQQINWGYFGMNGANPMDYSGTTSFIITQAAKAMNMTPEEFMQHQQYYQSHNGSFYEADSEGKIYTENDGKREYNWGTRPDGVTKYDPAFLNDFTNAMQRARMMQTQAQTACSTQQASYESSVSIWEQQMKEALEVEQNQALAPLEYEETMMELEKASVEEQLTYKKEELQNIKQELSERIKDDAPKFGL